MTVVKVRNHNVTVNEPAHYRENTGAFAVTFAGDFDLPGLRMLYDYASPWERSKLFHAALNVAKKHPNWPKNAKSGHIAWKNPWAIGIKPTIKPTN